MEPTLLPSCQMSALVVEVLNFEYSFISEDFSCCCYYLSYTTTSSMPQINKKAINSSKI